MIHLCEHNWHQWQYGNALPYGRQTANEPFKTIYHKTDKPIRSYKEELLTAAQSTMDHYPGLQPSIFFSGGSDSELVLRSYLAIGANPKVVIIRYENDYNIYDVSYAVTICSLLNTPYTIIDFNLTKFYENDAEDISSLAQIDRPRALPYCKFLEIDDGFPVLGEGDPYWVRLTNDYSQPGLWKFRDVETFIGWEKYAIHLDKPAVVQFLKWSPGLVLAHTKLTWFKKLINDEYYGKLGTNSTKLIGYREVYPDMIDRQKKTGFEKIDSLINEFALFLQKKYSGSHYVHLVDRTVDELWMEIAGFEYEAR